MIRMKSYIHFFMISAFMLDLARAGTQYEVKCSNKECSFTTSIGIGGGRMFEQASGYCKKCDRVVSATWKRGSKERPLRLKFWDTFAGKMRELFDCPNCKSPLVRIDQIEELKHCPKCGKDTLKSKRTILYD